MIIVYYSTWANQGACMITYSSVVSDDDTVSETSTALPEFLHDSSWSCWYYQRYLQVLLQCSPCRSWSRCLCGSYVVLSCLVLQFAKPLQQFKNILMIVVVIDLITVVCRLSIKSTVLCSGADTGACLVACGFNTSDTAVSADIETCRTTLESFGITNLAPVGVCTSLID